MTTTSAHVVIDGPGRASFVFELSEGITTLGRLPANDVVLDDQQVSRHHARISFFEREATFQDLDSHNGSLVNDRVVTTCVLAPDDVIRIGPYRIRFRAGPPMRSADIAPSSRSSADLETSSRRGGPSQLATLLLRAIDNTLVAPPREALARTLAAVDQAFHADRSALVRRRADGRLTFVHGREEGQTHDLPGVQSEVIEWVIQRRFPVSSENPREDPRFSASDSARPVACVPIGRDSQVWGALYVERATPSFSLTDLDGLQAVGHLVHAFIDQQQARLPPWRLAGTASGAPVATLASVFVLELAPATLEPSDTVSDDPPGEPWDPAVLGLVVEASQRSKGLWIGHDDRRILVAVPDEAGPHADADFVRRLEPTFRRSNRIRIGMARGSVALRDLRLAGATRLFGSGDPLRVALSHVQSAEWGALAAPADLEARLRAAGLVPRPASDGTLRVELLPSTVSG